MSAPRVIAELVVTGIRALGKATAAAGQQAMRRDRLLTDFAHKPENVPSSGPAGSSSSKSAITNQMQMTLDEAHLILNVKKEDPTEVIIKNYERIFTANSPAPVPEPSPSTSKQIQKPRGPTHSHYLQSKVYRALERIKAERGEEGPPGPSSVGDGPVTEGTGKGATS